MLWLNDLYQKILTDKGISDLFLSSFLYTHLQIDIMFYEGLVFTVFFVYDTTTLFHFIYSLF